MTGTVFPALAGLALLGATSPSTGSSAGTPEPACSAQLADEPSLRCADAAQLIAVREGNVAAIRALMHREYRVNAPPGISLSGATILRMFERREIRAELVDRVVETAIVAQTTGIIMGGEALIAGGTDQVIRRRFTNVYLFENGRWWFIGRHFNIVPESQPDAGRPSFNQP